MCNGHDYIKRSPNVKWHILINDHYNIAQWLISQYYQTFLQAQCTFLDALKGYNRSECLRNVGFKNKDHFTIGLFSLPLKIDSLLTF